MPVACSIRTGHRVPVTRLTGVLMLTGWTLGCGSAAPEPHLDSGIERAVAAISQPRLEQLLATLVSFGTRHTHSPPEPARGIRAAAQWIHDEMQRSSARLQVGFDVHDVPG
jgi:hypothetical protein